MTRRPFGLVRGLLAACLLLLLLLSGCDQYLEPAEAGSDRLRIASWNIQHLGWQEDKDYAALVAVARRFDFLAVQEAMTAEGIEQLRDELIVATGEAWETMYSHRIGRGSYKEKYAFLWRSSAVDYVAGAVVYLDVTDSFAREPYSARFRHRPSGLEFVAATVHILFGNAVEDRLPEIHALREYWDWLETIYPETPERLLMGDFNLAPSHEAWAELWEVARPLITEGATTLSTIDGRYANLYDNIIVAQDHPSSIVEAGILRFPELLELTHEEARSRVSDHAPVYVVLGR